MASTDNLSLGKDVLLRSGILDLDFDLVTIKEIQSSNSNLAVPSFWLKGRRCCGIRSCHSGIVHSVMTDDTMCGTCLSLGGLDRYSKLGQRSPFA